MAKEKPKVWITNRSSHDFSAAEKYGTLCYLTEGLMRKRNVVHMARTFESVLSDSSPDDYLLPTSLTIMSMVAALVFYQKHGRVNLLIFEDNTYRARTLVLKEHSDVPATEFTSKPRSNRQLQVK